jgi:A/G-specific adenine glycosylase
MDIGALFCKAKPACAECPLRQGCVFKRRRVGRMNSTATRPQGRFEGSRRQQRGRVIRALVEARSVGLMRLGPQVKVGFGKSDLPWLQELLLDLERDGLVALNRTRTRAALP